MQSTPSNTMARCTMSMRMIPSIVPRGKTHFRQAMHRHLIVPQERCRKAISAWSAPAAYQPGVLARNTGAPVRHNVRVTCVRLSIADLPRRCHRQLKDGNRMSMRR